MIDERDLERYSAKELLEFLENEPVIVYTTEILYDDFGESTLIEVFDIEKIKHDFLRSINRYVVVRRGQQVFIHDGKEHRDLLSIKVHDYDDEEAMQRAYDICEDLNNSEMHFVGKHRKL